MGVPYEVPPALAGQIVEVGFIAVVGAVEPTADRTGVADTASYTLHAWLARDARFEPWNDDPRGRSCRVRGRRLLQSEALRLETTWFSGDAAEEE